MDRKKRSKIWKIDKTKLIKIVKKSKTLTEILKYFDLANKGNQHKTLKARLIFDNINFSHIPLGNRSNKGRSFSREKLPLIKILRKNSNYNRVHLKKRLIKEKLLKEICYECKLKPIWNNKKLVLQLDHINGISNDNRLINLRLLCPNCHSQTNNFAGKSSNKNKND